MKLTFTDIKNLLVSPSALKKFIRIRTVYFKEKVYEKIHGIDVTKMVSLEELGLKEDRSLWYANSGNRYLERVLDRLDITPADAIIDVGCGKGGAIIKMAHYPFGKIAGVELSPVVYNVALKNITKLNLTNIRLINEDASNFTDYDGYNYIYFYHPFHDSVMQAVVEKIHSSLLRCPRKMTIIYKNPSYHETIIKDGIFQKVDELEADYDYNKFFIYTNTHLH